MMSCRSRGEAARSKWAGEPLERRVLLAVSTGFDKPAALARLDSNLAAVHAEYQAHQDSASADAVTSFRSGNSVLRIVDGRILIEAYANESGGGRALAEKIRALGAGNVVAFDRSVSAAVPIEALPGLAVLEGLRFARAVAPVTNTGSVTSQGDTALRAAIARNTYGVTGAGVKVGILSDSFDTGPGSYATDVATGDLPTGVQILEDLASQADEGRAMAQVIYDIAPGVNFAFATALNGLESFAANLLALKDAGADLIIDDVTYLTEPMFQDSAVAQAIDAAAAAGVAYLSHAGNFSNKGFESDWRAGPFREGGSIPSSSVAAPFFYGGTTFDFDPGTGLDDMQQFTLAAGQSIRLSLQWDSPAFSVSAGTGSPNDLDVYILDAAGAQIIAGSTTANIGEDPVEWFEFTNSTTTTQTYNLMIASFDGEAPGLIKYVDTGSANFSQFVLGSGTVWGHSNALSGRTIGAAWYQQTPAFGTTPPILRSYSSIGNTPVLFDTAGTRLPAPSIRNRPDLVGVDGVSTTVPGFTTFNGTSSAVAHAAGVAALILQADPNAVPQQLYAAMRSGAIDMDHPYTAGFDSGFDLATGYGLVRADSAVQSAIEPPGVWTGMGDGTSWSDPDNWSGSTLPGPTIDVFINVAANPTINVTGAHAVSSITSSESLGISGSLSVANASTFNGNVTLNGTLGGSGDITIHSTLNWVGGTIAGSGSLVISSSGVLSVSAPGHRVSERPVSIVGAAVLAPGSDKTLTLPGISLSGNGKLDLTDNALIVDYTGASSIDAIRGYLFSAYTGGAWIGDGITSSIATTTPRRTVGYSESSGLFAAFPATFAGAPVDSTAVLVRYAANGDANLDRKVDISDLGLLAGSWQQSPRNHNHGDFNFDRAVDITDLGIFATSWQTVLPSAAAAFGPAPVGDAAQEGMLPSDGGRETVLGEV